MSTYSYVIAPIVHIFWNPWPQIAYSLCNFHGATTKIKPCIAKNSVFPLWRLQSLLRMRSITWPMHRRSPKTTRNNFLTPNCLFTINWTELINSSKPTFWYHIWGVLLQNSNIQKDLLSHTPKFGTRQEFQRTSTLTGVQAFHASHNPYFLYKACNMAWEYSLDGAAWLSG